MVGLSKIPLKGRRNKDFKKWDWNLFTNYGFFYLAAIAPSKQGCAFVCVNLSKSRAIQPTNHKQHSILKFLWVSYVCTYLSQGALQLATHTAGVTNCQEVNSRKQGKEHIQEQNLAESKIKQTGNTA